MIDNEKIGKYIKKVRKENKLTQEELAKKLYISRQAVSNWEKGKTAPSVDNVSAMSELLDLSIVDVFAGETISDKHTVNDVIKSIVKLEMKKWKKILIIISIILFFVIVIFLAYYFITYYNNIIVYNIKGDSTSYNINGVINKSVNNLYFNLEIDKVSDKICLVHNNEDLVCNSDSNFIIFTQQSGYDEIIPSDKKEFVEYIKDLTISIENNNKVETINLNIDKDFQNYNLFKMEKDKVINNDSNYKLEFADVPNKIKNNFKYNEKDNCFYKKYNDGDKEIEILYTPKDSSYIVNEIIKNSFIKYIYDTNKKILLSYCKTNNNKIIKSYDDFSDIDKNKDKKKIYNYFKENYVDKYLN